MMTKDEMIANANLMLDHAHNGIDVEFRAKGASNYWWFDCSNPAWNFDECEYRRKPKPSAPLSEFYIDLTKKLETDVELRNMIVTHFSRAEEAKTMMRKAGFGVTGTDILETTKQALDRVTELEHLLKEEL